MAPNFASKLMKINKIQYDVNQNNLVIAGNGGEYRIIHTGGRVEQGSAGYSASIRVCHSRPLSVTS
jgi:hypothetical protein